MIEIVRTDGGGAAPCRTAEQRTARRRLRDLQVQFISLVPAAANLRTVLVKSAEESGLVVLEKRVDVACADAPRRIVYGIVYAPHEVDAQGDTVDSADIEKAAYDFMRAGRTRHIDSDHDGIAGRGYVAESWIVRPGDPLFPAETPGAWAVGVKVTDEATWQRLERGELRGISMAGVARPEPLPEHDAPEGGLFAKLRKMLRPEQEAQMSSATAEVPSAVAKAASRSDAALLHLAARTDELAARLDILERQTAGRRTLLGATPATLRKATPFRGLRIV